MEGKLLEEAPSEKDPKKGKFNWVFYNHNLKESSYCQGMKIMIVGQNPGKGYVDKEGFKEKEEIRNSKNCEDLVDIYRRALVQYFKDNGGNFWDKFFEIIKEDLGIEAIENGAINDNIFYTDLSKRRDFDENKGERLSLRNFTNKERILFLTEINKVKPALIICFGWVALDYFKEKYFGKIKRISIDNDRTDRKSTRLNSSHTDISRMPSSA